MNVFPIIFSGPMVRALLAGSKFQTRRIQTPTWKKVQPGDLLYVRENFWQEERWCEDCGGPVWTPADRAPLFYAATSDGDTPPDYRQRPSIHMPRWASRLTLEVTRVREEKLAAVEWRDARDEGLGPFENRFEHIWQFRQLWNELHGKKPGEAWEDNPTVIALTFKVHTANVDEFITTLKEKQS